VILRELVDASVEASEGIGHEMMAAAAEKEKREPEVQAAVGEASDVPENEEAD